ncbi:MAG: glutamate formimidoyltransferase, partial [Acidimicrobiia bacterium]|nr:glutamate formimidoyltransferase [Acidimicrobiia bacterium]
EEAAFQAMSRAAALIDMTKHSGEHPRMGATDVCPLVPLEGATMEDCIESSRRLAARVGEELDNPVYLYEYAALDGRRSLADVRRGEYEGLQSRADSPDFGPGYNPSTGATAIGARQFLVAYNINLNTQDRRLAHRVAQAVRELGTPRRDEAGKIIKDADGKTVFDPGRFREVKGVGWYIDEYRRAQVSLNLTDFSVSPIHEVFDACREEAGRLGLRVTGSELIGLVPRQALLAAGDHYLTSQGATTGVPESARIQAAVLSLGLDELAPFDPASKVIEYAFGGAGGELGGLPLAAFADDLSGDSPAPGGGSVAALAGALASALASMVAALTFSKKGMEPLRPEMEDLGRRAQELKDWFTSAIDRDTDAFNAVLTARRQSAEDIEAREAAIAAADLGATVVPLEVLESSVQALELILAVARSGNPTSVTDAGVGGWCGLAAAEGASLNVRINLQGLDGDHSDLIDRHDSALGAAREMAAEVAKAVEAHL